MKTKLKLLTFLLFLIFTSTVVKAQDIHFSQTSQVPLLINPASTGFFDGYYRAILNYKNQWASMGKAYSTFMGSFDMPLTSKRGTNSAYFALGTFIYSDKAGAAGYSTIQGDLLASCIVPLGLNHKLSVGLDAGFTYRNVDLNAIQWPNQYNGSAYDPNLPSNESSKLGNFFYFDMGAGLQYQYLKSLSRFYGRDMIMFNAGLAMFHATRMFKSANPASAKLIYPRIVLHTNLRYDLKGTRIGLIPSVVYMKQGPAYELNLGFLIRMRTGKETNFTGFTTESAFTLGVMYRYKDAVAPQIFFEIANFGIGLSYDISLSSFSNSLGYKGGLEVSIKYSKLRGALYKNWR